MSVSRHRRTQGGRPEPTWGRHPRGLVETLTSPGAGLVWMRHGASRIRHRSEV